MRSRLVEEALELLREHNLPAEIEEASHFKIRFINAQGRSCCLVISRSPSSQNAGRQNRAVLRRLLRRSAP